MSQVVGPVLREGLTLVSIGLVIGVGVGYAIARVDPLVALRAE